MGLFPFQEQNEDGVALGRCLGVTFSVHQVRSVRLTALVAELVTVTVTKPQRQRGPLLSANLLSLLSVTELVWDLCGQPLYNAFVWQV